MTIHHDKLAYGKLAKTSEEMSEEEIAAMLEELAGEESEDCGREECPRDKKRDKKDKS